MRQIISLLLVIMAVAACEELPSGDEAAPSSFEKAIDGKARQPGYFDLFTDGNARTIHALLPAADEDGLVLRTIHASRLTRGLGSNPIGLDRGWGNAGVILRFVKVGDRIFVEVENHKYRASADNPLEKKAIEESFGRSVIWSTPIVAENAEGELLIDLSGLLLGDWLGLADQLTEDGANTFSLKDDLSFALGGEVLAFPDNVEIDSQLTFSSSEPGSEVVATAPYSNNVTLTVHHSFVRLPDDGYQTRKYDHRVGTFALGFYDFSAPLTDQILQGYAMRHRLQREEPGNPDSPIVEPIIFYIDPGAPEAIRNALIDGASWWSDAFDAAGWEGGYRVELLPEDAHPLDIRYNVVQWVHRQTRGWSYGGGIIDPRTGEMLKGHVILGSQRVRQDRMIFEGLAGVEKSGSGEPDDPVELSLARIRQLSAHEVGHALGFGHNFAASVAGRASVEDYPAPWVKAMPDGTLDFSASYDSGIGEWDIVTVKWLYGDYPENEPDALEQVLADAKAQGLSFIYDSHGRGTGTSHPQAAVWDNGANPVAELQNVIRVREIALDNFDRSRLADGRPEADLREVLTPIYLYHRYQVEAAAKSIGGQYFAYGVNGVDNTSMQTVPARQQWRAVDSILTTLTPDFLDMPEEILSLMTPPTFDYWFNVPSEAFESRTTPAYDFVTAIESAADISLNALLNSQRLERMVQFHARNTDHPSLSALLDRMDGALFNMSAKTARQQLITEVVRGRYVFMIMTRLDGNPSQAVAATLRQRLQEHQSTLLEYSSPHNGWLASRIEEFLSRPAEPAKPIMEGPTPPPGSPIGASVAETCWHCDE